MTERETIFVNTLEDFDREMSKPRTYEWLLYDAILSSAPTTAEYERECECDDCLRLGELRDLFFAVTNHYSFFTDALRSSRAVVLR